MFQKTLRFLIFAVLGSVLCFLTPSLKATTGYSQDTEFVKKLADKAVESLRDEYDVLTTGNQPPRRLIPHHDEWGRPRSSEERLNDVFARRQSALKYGHPYTQVDIDLKPHGVDITADKIVLHATEEVALHFNRVHHPNEPVREDATRMRIEHNFVFTNPGSIGLGPTTKRPKIVAVAYRPQSPDPMIIADEQPPPDPSVDPSSPALFIEETGYVSPAVSPTVDCPSCTPASTGFYWISS